MSDIGGLAQPVQDVLTSSFDSTDEIKLDDIALAKAVVAQSSNSSLEQRAAMFSVVKKLADSSGELAGLSQSDATARISTMLEQASGVTSTKVDSEKTLFDKKVDTTAQDLVIFLQTQYGAQGQAAQANIGLDTEARGGVAWITKAKGFIGGLLTAGAEMFGMAAPAFAQKWVEEASTYSSSAIQGGSRIAQSSGNYSQLNALNTNHFDPMVNLVSGLIRGQQGHVRGVTEEASLTQQRVAPSVISGGAITTQNNGVDLGLGFSTNAPRPNVGDGFGARLRNSLNTMTPEQVNTVTPPRSLNLNLGD